MRRLGTAYIEWVVAVHWLTRLPWPYPPHASAPKLAHTVWAFPLVGALVGAVGGLAWMLLTELGATPLLSAMAAVIVPVLLTGLLHEDGFADYCDGMGCQGSAADRLAAMRDSRLGVFGVAGLVLLLLTRFAALAGLGSAAAAVAALMLSHAAGRFAIAPAMLALPLARADGAAVAADRPRASHVAASALALGLVVVAAIVIAGSAAAPLLAVVAALAVAAGIAFQSRRLLGGYTGDVLGAIAAASEVAALAVLSLAA